MIAVHIQDVNVGVYFPEEGFRVIVYESRLKGLDHVDLRPPVCLVDVEGNDIMVSLNQSIQVKLPSFVLKIHRFLHHLVLDIVIRHPAKLFFNLFLGGEVEVFEVV